MSEKMRYSPDDLALTPDLIEELGVKAIVDSNRRMSSILNSTEKEESKNGIDSDYGYAKLCARLQAGTAVNAGSGKHGGEQDGLFQKRKRMKTKLVVRRS